MKLVLFVRILIVFAIAIVCSVAGVNSKKKNVNNLEPAIKSDAAAKVDLFRVMRNANKSKRSRRK